VGNRGSGLGGGGRGNFMRWEVSGRCNSQSKRERKMSHRYVEGLGGSNKTTLKIKLEWGRGWGDP